MNKLKQYLAGMNPFAWWIGAWIRLFESLITILTFGFVYPTWSAKFSGWRIKTRCEQRKNNKNKEK